MTVTEPIIEELIKICGAKYVLHDDDSMAAFLTDWRGDYHGAAAAVIQPATSAEVAAIVSLANRRNTPIVPQGGNTSLCGGATPDDSGTAIIISMGRLNKLRTFDHKSQTITVEAGCILGDIQRAAAKHDLLFPLDLGARGTCQIGGNLSTNAGGLNVLRYGTARQLCLGLEVVMPDGRMLNLLSSLKKDNTGYDLKDLFIGAEGTLGVITAATLQLFPAPKAAATAWVSVTGINAAIDLLNAAQSASGGTVAAFEIMPKSVVENVLRHFPNITCPLKPIPEFSCLVEIASTAERDAAAADDGTMPLNAVIQHLLAEAMEQGWVNDAAIAQNQNQRQALWDLREIIPLSEVKAGKAFKSDISIPLEHIAAFYAEAAAKVTAIIPKVNIFAFGHLGDGNLHYNLSPPDSSPDSPHESKDDADFQLAFIKFENVLMELLKKYGGSISAEHGIGQKKRHLLAAAKDPAALTMMAVIKTAIDPKAIMNPGKII